jgi:predicted anti-sigma-YlaC factor YlaD
MKLLVTVPQPEALLKQVLAWDDSYGGGSVHELFISFYASVPAEIGGSERKARLHFQRALDLSRGLTAGPYLSLASSVSVKNQDPVEFRELLAKALAIDVDADQKNRLQNVINQRKARWMLSNIDRFFLVEEGQE